MTFRGRNDGGARLSVPWATIRRWRSSERTACRPGASTAPGTTPSTLTNEHGSYDDPNSESLDNIAAVVAGEPDLAVAAEPRQHEPFVETHSPIEIRGGRFGLPVIEFHSPVEVNPFPDDPEWGRDPTRRTHNPEGIPG